MRSFAGFWFWELRTFRAPSRLLLKNAILPELAARGGRILLVGVRSYTAAYPRIIARSGATCWTLDIDPAAVRYGAKDRHVIGDVRRLAEHFSLDYFDAVVLSGVFGFGVDTTTMQDAALSAVAKVLKPGGVLVLGWNDNRSADPASLAAYQHFQWRDRKTTGSSHVFDYLVRR